MKTFTYLFVPVTSTTLQRLQFHQVGESVQYDEAAERAQLSSGYNITWKWDNKQ